MAKSVGGKAANQRSKDQSRAADLKARNIARTVGRCPICNRMVGLGVIYEHIAHGCRR